MCEVAIEISVHRMIGSGLLTHKNSTWCQEWDFEMEHIKPPNEMVNSGRHLGSGEMAAVVDDDGTIY